MFSDDLMEEEADDDELEQTELEVSRALGIDLSRFVKHDVLETYKKEVTVKVKEVL